MNIIVTGSLAYDRIMNFPDYFRKHILPEKIHILNVSFVLDKMDEHFGGTAGNIAYNLNLLGLAPDIVSVWGKDFEKYKSYFDDLGISTEHIQVDGSDYTAVANITTDLDDNQISAFYPGVLSRGAEVEIPRHLARQGSFLVVSASSKREITRRCLFAQSKNISYMFDPGQQMTALSGEEMRRCAKYAAIAIFNDYEWQMFRAKSGQELDDLTQQGVTVIVTKGAVGSIIYTKDQDYEIGTAKPGEVVDPTGAGDAYRAGIVAGFVGKWDWGVAGEIAATIASYAVEYAGTQTHKPSKQEIRDRFKSNFNSECPM